jgi:hypothetical protein
LASAVAVCPSAIAPSNPIALNFKMQFFMCLPPQVSSIDL